jgi:hypothetical protein
MSKPLYRIAAAAVLAIALAPASAIANTFAIPDENPVATISVPESWEPKPYDGGLEATSPDGRIYLAVEEVRANDVGGATEDGVKWFAEQGVDIDQHSLKTQDMTLNGLPAFDMAMRGKDKDGPTEVGMMLVGTNAEGKFLLIYYWGSQEGQQANGAELKKIAASLQATK